MKHVAGMGHALATRLLILVAVVACHPGVLACSCDFDYTTAVALKESAAVFEGTVVGVDHRYLRAGWISLRFLASTVGLPTRATLSEEAQAATRYSFRVEHAWKGVLEATVVVTSNHGNCACEFAKGARYLVFASADGSELTTNICMGTTAIAHAQDTLAELKKLSVNAAQ